MRKRQLAPCNVKKKDGSVGQGLYEDIGVREEENAMSAEVVSDSKRK